jgi:hypothetical protein
MPLFRDKWANDDHVFISQEAFEKWWDDADQNHDGYLTRMELLKSSFHVADGSVSAFFTSVGEFQLMHTIMSHDGTVFRFESVNS